jgi:excisionase family DNA binding protein
MPTFRPQILTREDLAARHTLSVQETAVVLSTSKDRLYALVASGDVPTVRASGRRRIPASWVRAQLGEDG